MAEYVIVPNPTRPIANESGIATQEFRVWIQTISNRSLIIGSGSPEGVIIAPIGSEYMNSAGTASSIKYIKRDSDIAGDKSQGWILI